eukprot:432635-Rhodomonas_salina.1
MRRAKPHRRRDSAFYFVFDTLFKQNEKKRSGQRAEEEKKWSKSRTAKTEKTGQPDTRVKALTAWALVKTLTAWSLVKTLTARSLVKPGGEEVRDVHHRAQEALPQVRRHAGPLPSTLDPGP